MNVPDPADSASSSGQVHPHSHRRFWRWGIWFWLVAWIVSILGIFEFSANLKGIAGIEMLVGTGGAGVEMRLDRGFHPNGLRIQEPQFIWTHWKTLAKNPEDFLGILGHAGRHDFAGHSMLTLPIAGFLWLWLIGVWTDGFQKFRWPDPFGSKRTMARIATLVSLPLLILLSDHRWKVSHQRSGCILMIRNIQQAVRSHQGMKSLREGDPMPWDEIFGSKNFVPLDGKKCPGGRLYRLTPHVPRRGEVAAQCPDPEHHGRMEQIDTSGW
jgi:hypothetical protein